MLQANGKADSGQSKSPEQFEDAFQKAIRKLML